MKKTLTKLFAIIFVFPILFLLFSCDTKTNTTTTSNETEKTTTEENKTTTEETTTTTISEYAVSFDSDGGSSVESTVIKNGLSISKPVDPTKDDYDFVGWFVGDKEWNFEDDKVTSNLTLVAHWSAKKYSLTIKYNDGATEDLVLLKEANETIGSVDIPTRSGYSFDGWDITIPRSMPKEDIVVNAKWKCQVTYTIVNRGVRITGISGSIKDVVILNKYDNCYTRIIEDNAFKDCSSIESITLPNTITKIGANAFYGCTSLKSVETETGISEIGTYAFYNCTSLTSFSFPSSIVLVGDYAFANCTNLSYVLISSYFNNIDSVTNRNVFTNCPLLKTLGAFNSGSNVELKDVIRIPDSLFFGSTSLETVNIPDGIKEIGFQSFCVAESIKTLTIPSSVVTIDYQAYAGCTLIETIVLSVGVKTLGAGAFVSCSSLKTLVIPNTVTSIGNSCFRLCSSLKRVIIPNSVTSIGNGAFSGCEALEYIYIPKSVSTIESSAFICDYLLTIHCEVEEAQPNWSSTWNELESGNGTVTVVFNEKLEEN